MSEPPNEVDGTTAAPLTTADLISAVQTLVMVVAATSGRITRIEKQLDEITTKISDQETNAAGTAVLAAAAALPAPPAAEPPRQRPLLSGRKRRVAQQMALEQIEHGATEDMSW